MIRNDINWFMICALVDTNIDVLYWKSKLIDFRNGDERSSVDQMIKSNHKYESTGARFDINTELDGMKTSIILSN